VGTIRQDVYRSPTHIAIAFDRIARHSFKLRIVGKVFPDGRSLSHETPPHHHACINGTHMVFRVVTSSLSKDCSVRVSSGTATGVTRKLPRDSLPAVVPVSSVELARQAADQARKLFPH